MRGLVLLLSLALGPHAAIAEERPPVHSAQFSGRNHADCFCRAQGRLFAYGESACLRTPEGPRLAECQMETNVTSWTLTAKPCPES
jgi:hypothetical protein